MLEIIPNYHPIMVNFTIALVVTSFIMLILSFVVEILVQTKTNIQQECLIVSRWCLWLAALISILTIIAGLSAYYSVGHDAISHKVMTMHRNFGILSFIIILLMAIYSFVLYLKQRSPSWLFTLLLAITVVLVAITGWYGTQLVYRYGLGVKSLPQKIIFQSLHNDKKHLLVPIKNMDNHKDHDHEH